jgi:hypothetical protein
MAVQKRAGAVYSHEAAARSFHTGPGRRWLQRAPRMRSTLRFQARMPSQAQKGEGEDMLPIGCMVRHHRTMPTASFCALPDRDRITIGSPIGFNRATPCDPHWIRSQMREGGHSFRPAVAKSTIYIHELAGKVFSSLHPCSQKLREKTRKRCRPCHINPLNRDSGYIIRVS